MWNWVWYRYRYFYFFIFQKEHSLCKNRCDFSIKYFFEKTLSAVNIERHVCQILFWKKGFFQSPLLVVELAQNILSMMHCSNVEIWHHWIVDKHKLFQFPGCCCIHSGKKCKNSAKNKFSRQDMILKHLKDLNKDYFATSGSINYKDMPSTKVIDFFGFLKLYFFS